MKSDVALLIRYNFHVRDVVFILFKGLFTPHVSINANFKDSASGDIDVGTENGFCVCVTVDTIQTLTLTPTLIVGTDLMVLQT